MQGGKGSMSRIERDRMRLAILEEASIVCSTLSFAGSPMLYRLSRKYVPPCMTVVYGQWGNVAPAASSCMMVVIEVAVSTTHIIHAWWGTSSWVVQRTACNDMLSHMRRRLDMKWGQMHPTLCYEPLLHMYNPRTRQSMLSSHCCCCCSCTCTTPGLTWW
jgi:hypothetical protein